MLAGTVNDDADIPGFISTYKPTFPVGKADTLGALTYFQFPKGQRPHVPMMVFVDRQGIIRAQYMGGEGNFFDNQQEQHIRDEAEKWLKGAAAKPAPAKPAKTKPAA